jgi:hypothetical protein
MDRNNSIRMNESIDRTQKHKEKGTMKQQGDNQQRVFGKKKLKTYECLCPRI